MDERRLTKINRREIIIFSGFILTFILIVAFVVLGRLPPVVEGWDYVYGLTEGKYRLFLRIDRDGKLWQASYERMSSDTEVAGIRGFDRLEDVVAKLGNPVKKIEWSMDGVLPTRKAVLFFPYGRGDISAEFEDNELVGLTFIGDSPRLPEGFQVGMSKEDIDRMGVSPDSIKENRAPRSGLLLDLLLLISAAFWGALLIDIKPQWRGGFKYFLLFIIYWLSFGVLLLGVGSYLFWLQTFVTTIPPTSSRGAIWPLLLVVPILGFPCAILAIWIRYSSGIRNRALSLIGTTITVAFSASSFSIIWKIAYLRLAMMLPLFYRLINHIDITPITFRTFKGPLLVFALWSIFVLLWHCLLHFQEQPLEPQAGV